VKLPWLAACLLALASSGSGCRSSEPEGGESRPNFLVIDIDSLRADRLLARREGQLVAPTLAGLAERGVSFDLAISQSGWTIPALVTLLTGRYPLLHDQRRSSPSVFRQLDWTEAGARSLPRILGSRGYRSAAFWGNTVGGDYRPASDGFDLVYAPLRDDLTPILPPDPLSWLDGGEAPFFILLHEIDLHGSEALLTDSELHGFVPSQPACQGARMNQVLPRLSADLGREGAIEHAIGHYDAGLRWYDARVRGVLDGLADRDLLDDTVLIITANHGEDLAEHGLLHHVALYDSVLRIPLLWVDPALPAHGARRPELVQQLDLAPSILARASLPAEPELPGRSLLPLLGLEEGAWEERDVYSASNVQQASLRTRSHKLILDMVGPATDPGAPIQPPAGRYALFDLQQDPGEQTDRFLDEPGLALTLVDRLLGWRESRIADTPLEPARASDDPRLKEALRQRGYWEVAVPAAATPQPPPEQASEP